VQASAAGVAVGISGIIRDLVSGAMARHGVPGSFGGQASGYMTVYAIEIVLLVMTMLAMAPLVVRRPAPLPGSANVVATHT
jgi:BCD family chlorophyll transporter-like MFS transporter